MSSPRKSILSKSEAEAHERVKNRTAFEESDAVGLISQACPHLPTWVYLVDKL